MPSSLLPSRSALSSESISARSLAFISSRCCLRSARNFFRFAAVDFFAIARHLSLSNPARNFPHQIVAESTLDPGAHELAGIGLATQHHHPVDFRCLERASPAHSRGAPRHHALNHYLNLAAYKLAILP